MARKIRATRPNGNSTFAVISNADDGYIEVEILTADGHEILTTIVSDCTVRARHPRNYYPGDVCLAIFEVQIRVHVGTVVITGTSDAVKVSPDGLDIEEE